MGYNPEEWTIVLTATSFAWVGNSGMPTFPLYSTGLPFTRSVMSSALHISSNVLIVSCFCQHPHLPLAGEHYVHFECKNLANYAQAEQSARNSVGMTMDKLCSSPIYSQFEPYRQLGFVPHDYSTVTYYDMWHKKKDGQLDGTYHHYTVTYGRKYDI